MRRIEISFPSANGEHTIAAAFWRPDHEIRGILQLCHGMREYFGRYDEFAAYMADNGFLVCCNDHVGHGKSIIRNLGYMGDNILNTMIADMDYLRRQAIEMAPDVPYFVLGHSMGTYIALEFTKHYDDLSGVILSGLCHYPKWAHLFIPIVNAFGALRPHHTELHWIVQRFSSGYSKKMGKPEISTGWLTTDDELAKRFHEDKTFNFNYSNAGYRLIFNMIRKTLKRNWTIGLLKAPVLIFSGQDDPLGAYGLGPVTFYTKLADRGCKDLSIRVYPGGRHEMINDSARQDIYGDIKEWLVSQMDESKVLASAP